MPKSILIFGAGINQLTLIEAAKELGLISVVLDPGAEPPGKAKADFFYQVGKDDYKLTREIALKHQVAGIVTGQMENPLRLMARLAEEMGFIFHSPEVIERSTNKYLMKQSFLAAGVPCARGELIKDGRILSETEFKEYALPVIIKPLQAFSSRGVYRIDSYQRYLDKIGDTLSFSQDESYLLEEFIEGPEYSVESITYRGDTKIIQYTEKLITPYPETVEIGHVQPAEFSEEQKIQIDLIVKKAINALGIDNSAAHTEMKWTGNGPVIIEIGPRLGGDFISSYLTLASTGVSMDKAAIQVALGENPEIGVKLRAGSAIRYLTLEAGRIVESIDARINQLSVLPAVLMYHLNVIPGDVIQPLTDSAKRSGWVIVKGDNYPGAREQAESALVFLKNCIKLQ